MSAVNAGLRPWLKSVIPQPLIDSVRRATTPVQGVLLNTGDAARFWRHFSRSARSGDPGKLRSQIIFHTHAIEKGLSHAELRPGFGGYAMGKLLRLLDQYRRHELDQNDKAYLAALATLRAYRDVNNALGCAETPLSAAPPWILDAIGGTPTELGGAVAVEHVRPRADEQRTFADVLLARRSVREFADRPVRLDAVHEAIALATRSPSVCNRQTVRVRVVTDPAVISRLQHAQGGLLGYSAPPVMLAVTSDLRGFVHVTERNQPYVDGGLFCMSLLLGLESVDLAACALNAMFGPLRERTLRSILGVPGWEVFVAFIAVGEFPDSYRTPVSFRYGASEITL